MMRAKARIIIGVVGNDIHVVANRILARGLRQAGYEVCNLGVNVPCRDFVMSAIEYEADAVIVSSINGEGEGWVKDLRQDFLRANLGDTVLYIGGNLAIGDQPRDSVEERFRTFGFNRAYHRPDSMDILLRDLEADLLNVT